MNGDQHTTNMLQSRDSAGIFSSHLDHHLNANACKSSSQYLKVMGYPEIKRTFKTPIQKLPGAEKLSHAGLSELRTETETKNVEKMKLKLKNNSWQIKRTIC